MMTIKTTLKKISLLVALAAAGIAHAALVPQVNFVELGLDELGVPAHEADRLTIMPCQGCEAQTVRLTADTVYRVSGHGSAPVEFREFREAASDTAEKSMSLVYVGYAVETNQVVELVLDGAE